MDVGAQLVAHGVGDYVLQSDWMALNKTQRWGPAVAHAATYTLAFTPLTRRPRTLALIGLSHLLIDHYRLARYVCWAKNFLAPKGSNPPWDECRATGYPPPPDRPAWMTVWLMILADNTLHALCNAAALAAEGQTALEVSE